MESTKTSKSSRLPPSKWQRTAYEKHRERLRDMKPTLRTEKALTYNHQELQLQMRLRRAMAEEQRQRTIDQQNVKILERIVTIMTSKKSTFPGAPPKETKDRKVSRTKKMSQEVKQERTVKLPPLK